jgi:hypothetical protein
VEKNIDKEFFLYTVTPSLYNNTISRVSPDIKDAREWGSSIVVRPQ